MAGVRLAILAAGFYYSFGPFAFAIVGALALAYSWWRARFRAG